MDRHEELQAAGSWLRTQRERRNLSVRELANAVGASTQAVYNWETGKNAVSDDSAERLAELFGRGILEVRRHLGLWVPVPPDDQTASTDERIARAEAAADRASDELEALRRELRDLRGETA